MQLLAQEAKQAGSENVCVHAGFAGCGVTVSTTLQLVDPLAELGDSVVERPPGVVSQERPTRREHCLCTVEVVQNPWIGQTSGLEADYGGCVLLRTDQHLDGNPIFPTLCRVEPSHDAGFALQNRVVTPLWL